MAQNRKADVGEVRKSLLDALSAAKVALKLATENYTEETSLENLRQVQVATDRLNRLSRELRLFEDARSIESVRRADQSPSRQKPSWPVGLPYDESRPARRRTVGPPEPEKETPPLPPPAGRPDVLKDRLEEGERVSWWVGRDRSSVQAGARALQAQPQSATSRVPSKEAIKKDAQRLNEQRRETIIRRETLSRTLQDRLQPLAGAFNVIPKAE